MSSYQQGLKLSEALSDSLDNKFTFGGVGKGGGANSNNTLQGMALNPQALAV